MLQSESRIEEFDAYRITNHGENVWTQEALGNVALLQPFFEAARQAVRGRFTSVYRDARVNRLVGGVSGSRHCKGLACDIKPAIEYAPERAAGILWTMACREELGPCVKIIIEPTWVHLGWDPILRDVPTRALLRKVAKGYEMAERWARA